MRRIIHLTPRKPKIKRFSRVIQEKSRCDWRVQAVAGKKWCVADLDEDYIAGQTLRMMQSIDTGNRIFLSG
jgi:hypothetical protein